MKRLTGPTPEEARRAEIHALLQELTEWRRLSGFDPEESVLGEVRSTGESNAAMLELRRQLQELGARFHWSPERREYVLEEGTEEGTDEEENPGAAPPSSAS